MWRLRVFLSVTACCAPPLAHAQQQQASPTPSQQAAPAVDDESEADDVVVTGSRTQPGAAVGDIPPEQQLSPADIRSYGVGSLSELLTELSPQTRSDRGSGGAPVVLLNGRRIGSFAEIRDIPTEAIQRVDILPEEVALKYGYPADQKVVNVVLRRRFRATTLEAAGGAATEGGRATGTLNGDFLHLIRDNRFNLHLTYQEAGALTEAERDIALPADTAVDDRAYRSLLPQTQTFSGNVVYARPLSQVTQLTVNGRVQADDGRSLQGLSAGGDPLPQDTSALTAHLGTSLNGSVGKWRWSAAGNYDNVASDTYTTIDLATPGGALATNLAHSVSRSGDANALAAGPVLTLPAGDLFTSVRVGASTLDFDSHAVRFGTPSDGHVARDTGSGQVNVDVPITSRRKQFGAAVGDLSVNFNAAVNHLSDFGTLTTIGYGANWSPIPALRFIASVTDQDDAPSPNQLADPVVTTLNARVFDFVRGETVDVTRVTGGNAALIADNRHVVKVGLTAKPFAAKDLTFTANYVRTRVDDPISTFPSATAAIQAAFPDRFQRDADGNLTRIDTRPVNFARSGSSELRYGFNLSLPLKSHLQKAFEAFRNGTGPNPLAGLNLPRRGGDGAGRPGDGLGAGGGFRGGGFGGRGGGFGGRGQAGGRLQFALYHTWHFTDTVLVRDGGPLLDLLNGDTAGAGGGQPRHELEGQAGYSNNGIGVRFSANWNSATRVAGGTPLAPDPLRFSDLTTVDLRLFADLGQRLDWVRKHPWLRGVRVTLSATNLFDQRQRVTDASGITPVSYQPDYLDPLGRSVKLTVRKLFF